MSSPRIVTSRLPPGTHTLVVEIVDLQPEQLHQLRTDLEAWHRRPTEEQKNEITRRVAELLGTADMDRVCLAFEAGTGIELGAMRRRSER